MQETSVKYNGRDYKIPDMWLAGFCSTGLDGRRRELVEAIAWWAWQEELRELDEETMES